MLNHKLIAHAGGTVEGKKYTNALEAIKSSVEQQYKFIELDIVASLDQCLIAHDGMEHAYGLATSFSNITEEEFLKLKIYQKFTPPSFNDIFEILEKHQDIYFILDTKFTNLEQFSTFFESLSKSGFQSRFIPQVYDSAEGITLSKLGYAKMIFALWKKFSHDFFCEKMLQELSKLNEIPLEFFAVSLRYYKRPSLEITLEDSRLDILKKNVDLIFLHDLDISREQELIESGFGIFK